MVVGVMTKIKAQSNGQKGMLFQIMWKGKSFLKERYLGRNQNVEKELAKQKTTKEACFKQGNSEYKHQQGAD